MQTTVTMRREVHKRLPINDLATSFNAARGIAALAGAQGAALNAMYSEYQAKQTKANIDLDRLFFDFNARGVQGLSDLVKATNPAISVFLEQLRTECALAQANYDAYVADIFQYDNQLVLDAFQPLVTQLRIQAVCVRTGLTYLTAGYYNYVLDQIYLALFYQFYPIGARQRTAVRYVANARISRITLTDSLTKNEDIALINAAANNLAIAFSSVADVQRAMNPLLPGAATSISQIRSETPPSGERILTFLNSYCTDADTLLGTLQSTTNDNIIAVLNTINSVAGRRTTS